MVVLQRYRNPGFGIVHDDVFLKQTDLNESMGTFSGARGGLPEAALEFRPNYTGRSVHKRSGRPDNRG